MDFNNREETGKRRWAEDGTAYSGREGKNRHRYQEGRESGSGRESSGNRRKNSGSRYSPYQESDAVQQAKNLLNQQMSQRPGEYQSQWQLQLNDTINKILNREKFSYDLNGDALYQQYKDQYTNQGKLAMMDTMGQAAALTGGYGNSYAQSVGQQAYQGYLQQLSDKIPELYQLALSKYQMEGDDLYNQYSLLGNQENQDYGRYRDTVADWNTDTDRLYSQYNNERNFDYGQWSDERSFQYQQERDKIADAQWQAEFDEAVRQWQMAWDAEHPVDDGAAVVEDSGGSSPRKPSADPDGEKKQLTFGDIGTAANKMVSNGASDSRVNNYINAAKNAGVITTAQAKSLKIVMGV